MGSWTRRGRARRCTRRSVSTPGRAPSRGRGIDDPVRGGDPGGSPSGFRFPGGRGGTPQDLPREENLRGDLDGAEKLLRGAHGIGGGESLGEPERDVPALT